MSAPFAVPNDDTIPWPVSIDRVGKLLGDMDYHVDVVIPDKALGAVFDKVPFLFSMDSAGRFLSVRAIWETNQSPAEMGPWVFAASDNWNREMYFPTLYSITSDEHTVQICADWAVDTMAGLSNTQLRENIETGISMGISAISYMQEAAEETLKATDEPDRGGN